jgi:hypothetical protein
LKSEKNLKRFQVQLAGWKAKLPIIYTFICNQKVLWSVSISGSNSGDCVGGIRRWFILPCGTVAGEASVMTAAELIIDFTPI